MIFIRKIIDLILYSNLFIAFCAVAMTWQTQYILFGHFQIDIFSGLIFFATLWIYALHRLVGLFSVKAFLEEGRFHVIHRYKKHIWGYTLLSSVGLAYCFFYTPIFLKFALFIPFLISLGYVVPFLGQKKQRLRDLDGIKIFLIAIVWAYVTVFLPILAIRPLQINDFFLFLERTIFIFAIAIPFDIRDLKIDTHNNVKTLPSVYGVSTVLRWINWLLFAFIVLVFFNYYLLLNRLSFVIALITSTFFTYFLIKIAVKKQDDYYYSGLIDGTMLLQFLIVLGFDKFL